MLQGKGFSDIINLSGGIRAWNGETAIGPADQGLALFADMPSLEGCLTVAFSLEKGLEDFYRSLLPKIQNADAKKIFEKLADIEINHQQRIFETYLGVTGQSITRETFEQDVMAGVVEGGLTTEAYLDLFKPDLNAATDIVSMAMSIEAQALDLYQRAAEAAADEPIRAMLTKIAGEEHTHLNELGKLMDRLA